MAPEIASARGNAGYLPKAADVWSCGVLLFAMLYGKFPFDSEQQDPNSAGLINDIEKQQKWLCKGAGEGGNHFLGVDMSGISEDCRDMLHRIFVLDPQERITTKEIRNHPWYLKRLPPAYIHSLEGLEERQRVLTNRSKNFFAVHGDWLQRQQRSLQVMLTTALRDARLDEEIIWVDLRRGAAEAEAEAEQSQGGQESPQKKFGLEPIPDGPQRRDSFASQESPHR